MSNVIERLKADPERMTVRQFVHLAYFDKGKPGGGAANPADPGPASRLARVARGRVGQGRNGVVRQGRLLREREGAGRSIRLSSTASRPLPLVRLREVGGPPRREAALDQPRHDGSLFVDHPMSVCWEGVMFVGDLPRAMNLPQPDRQTQTRAVVPCQLCFRTTPQQGRGERHRVASCDI